MFDNKRYIAQISKEKEQVLKTAFWAEIVKEINKEKKNASRHCETDEVVKAYQGELRAWKKILNLPDKIIENLEKTDKRE